MPQLPQVEGLSKERRTVWKGLRDQLWACREESGAARDAAEAAVEARMRAVRESDPDLFLAVDEYGLSLMHEAARWASGAGVVRCVWECCGERALQIMRHTTPWGSTVLLFLALNRAMTRGMYAVFAEHCTNYDLSAADNDGWTVLFRMALTFIHDAKTEERQENVASVMCAVVQRLGPGALLAETTKEAGGYGKKYPAGSTPRSILHDAGDRGRSLLQRLEEAAAHPEAAEAEEKAGTASASAERKESPPPARPAVDSRACKALQRWIFRNTDIVDATDEWASALVRAGVVDEETLQTRFDADPSCLREIIPVASDRAQIEEALRTRPAPPTGRASSTVRSTPGAKPAEPSTDSVWDADPAAVMAEADAQDARVLRGIDAKVDRIQGALASGLVDAKGGGSASAVRATAPVDPQRLLKKVQIARLRLPEDAVETEDDENGFGITANVFAGTFRLPGEEDARLVAVKYITVHGKGMLVQGLQELERQAGMEHENVVSLYGFMVDAAALRGRRNGSLALVLELAELGDLRSALDLAPLTPHTLTPDAAFPAEFRGQFALDVAEALSYVHTQGMVHRDVKSRNCVIFADLTLKLTDFGISRPADRTKTMTRGMGTPGYIAPEMRVGELYDHRVDVFALGMLCGELLSRELPAETHAPLPSMPAIPAELASNPRTQRIWKCLNEIHQNCTLDAPSERWPLDLVVSQLRVCLHGCPPLAEHEAAGDFYAAREACMPESTRRITQSHSHS